jgi:hemoglobin
MEKSLYERLGGSDKITKIAGDLTDLHILNARIASRYADSDPVLVKKQVSAFFIAGTGGPDNYTGKDMLAAHRGMNIDNDEFMAVLDDVMQALDMNQVGQREKEEVLFILYSLKSEVVYV